MGYADYEDIDIDEIIDDMDADMELLEEMRAERLEQLRGDLCDHLRFSLYRKDPLLSGPVHQPEKFLD